MHKIASSYIRKLGFAWAAARNNTTSTSPRINPKGQSYITKNLDGTVTKGGPRRSWSVPPQTGEIPVPPKQDYAAIKEIPQQPVAMSTPAPLPAPPVPPNLTQAHLAKLDQYPGQADAAIRARRLQQLQAQAQAAGLNR